MRIALLMAHPDDAELWCGGTITKHTRQGDEVRIYGFCDQTDFRLNLAVQSAKTMGASYERVNYDRNFIESFADFEPQILISHWEHDSHPEHVMVYGYAYSLIIELCKIAKPPVAFLSCTTYHGQGKMNRTFNPDYYLDVSDEWKVKIRAINFHTDQFPVELIDEVKPIFEMYGNRIRVRYAEGFIENPIFGRYSSCGKIISKLSVYPTFK